MRLSFFVILISACLYAFSQDFQKLREAVYKIESEIKKRHLPFDTIVEVIFDKPKGGKVVGYTGYGDSPIWSGHYLAAEAFRYAVTKQKQAIKNAKRVLKGITRLIYVSGKPGRLVRFAVPEDDPFAKKLPKDDRFEGRYRGKDYLWTGNFISRDQYAGVMFGMAIAYDLIDDRALRKRISQNVTDILNYLLKNKWVAYRQDGSISTTWALNFHQQLCYLQIGRRVNPEKFEKIYRDYAKKYSSKVKLSIAFTCMDKHSEYYKFNLAHITMYNLIRLEKNRVYKKMYIEALKILRKTVGGHKNAHFNMLAMGVMPELRKKIGKQTVGYLFKWLKRPRRNVAVKNSNNPDIKTRKFVSLIDALKGKKAGRLIAKDPLPIELRPTTDFLWQRNPFKLDGGGDGRTQPPGLDLILPYWMARYYKLISSN